MTDLASHIQHCFAEILQSCVVDVDELTIEVPRQHMRDVCLKLRDDAEFKFEQLMDVCGVDYIDYGVSEWITTQATASGFERGVNELRQQKTSLWEKPRFAVVYHLLSLTHNHRIRIRTYADDAQPVVASVVDIWPSANWFEREAFDLYGILFEGHPDLRRILTDYGFIGHPFRKDFPLSGNVEVRYDAAAERVIYEAVSITPRTLVPKVIRAEQRPLPEEKNHG